MQSNITLTGINRVFCKISMALAFLFLISGTMQAQTYVNGNLGTGATSNNGTAAPAGTTWHELQNNTGNTTESNSTLGVSHASFGTTNNTLADDFTVPAGQTWNISTLRVYSIDQVTATTTSPYTNIRVRIYNGVPGAGGTVVYGDMTTNRFAATAYTAKRAIFNSQVPTPGTPTPNLPIFSIDATINTSLTAGTYWVEWQVVNTVNCFSLTSQTPGVRAVAGSNAMQSIAGAWATLIDGGSPAAAPDVNIELPFTLNYTATGAACTAVSPGNTISSAASVCPSTPFNLSVQTPGSGVGLTYQWQSSPNNTTYTDIAGATNPTYTASQTAATWYRLRVTCGANPALFSNPVNVTMSTSCYCIPAASDCTDGDIITNVTLGTLNNNSACGTAGYTNYTTNTGITVPDLIQGGSIPISVTAGDGGFTENVGVWIDYNQNGVFETSEFTAIGLNAATPIVRTGNIAVPGTALLGNTRMRVRVRFSTQLTGADPCTAYTFGETEDYTVKIVPCVPVTITGSPAAASVACGAAATFTVTATGSLPAYQWEYRTSATAPWILITNTPPYSGANTATLTVNPAIASMSGYQYRAIVSGACTGPDFSSPATLTVTALPLSITPATYTKCLADAPVLIAAPSTQTIANFTNSTPGAVADGDLTGISRNVTVSGITGPVQKVRVKINANSDYIGDLVISLKAPNGQIINLDYLLNKTNNGPSTGSGFVNTIFNLNRTVQNNPSTNVPAAQAINNFNAPYTAEFPIDNQQATFFVGVPSGPTGFAATTTNPAALYPTAASANGVWTLAMYDAGPPDPAQFLNYTLEITYGGAPATVVFSPVTGLYTDAAGTIPYTGTAVTQVYAAPTASTTAYSAVISAGQCSTAAQTITVNVNTPIGGTATLANQTVCSGTNVTLAPTYALTGGPGFTYQWQVSTPTAPTFTNIAGATSSTYVVTAPTTAQNGNQYRVIVSTGGNCGTPVTSTVATLTVNPAPVVVISASPSTTVIPGSTVTLTAAVSPNGAASYQWFKNGVAVPGATNNTLVVGIDGIGSYTVKVTDVNGCTNAAQASTPASISITTTATTQLFIYPSPNTGKFQVRYFNDLNDGPNGPAILNVYDSKGSRVFTRRYVLGPGYQSMAVDLASHGKGVYRVDLLNTNGERIKTGNVLVY